jgi:hypothetical protein
VSVTRGRLVGSSKKSVIAFCMYAKLDI